MAGVNLMSLFKRERQRRKFFRNLLLHLHYGQFCFMKHISDKRLNFINILMRKWEKRKPRSLWCRPRLNADFWEDRILSSYVDMEFRQDFRMSKKVFLLLCNMLRGHLQKNITVMRKPLTVERRVAITLYKLANPFKFRSIGNIFSVARNTACVVFHEVIKAIGKELVPLITFPSEEQLKKVVDGFSNNQCFPQCCGALGGTHIPIIAPRHYPNDYCNTKGWHSVLMQAVVDHRGKFIDIVIGWPGSVHDARVLGHSQLYEKAETNLLFQKENDIIIEEQKIPLMIIGDPAYPLKTWLMRGFSDDGKLSPEEEYFNCRLNSVRMIFENAIGRLKGRWRCLLKRNDLQLKNLIPVIAACCALHNLCEDENEFLEGTLLNLAHDECKYEQPETFPLSYAQDGEAQAIRNTLVKSFNNEREFL